MTFAELARTGVLAYGDGYRTKSAELGQPGFPVLRVAQVAEGRIVPDGVTDWVRDEFAPRIGPKLSAAGDVVLTTKGTFGRRARIAPETAGFVYSPQVCYFRVNGAARLDRGFLYSWLGSVDFLNQARSRTAQTDMADYLSLRDLGTIEVPVPPIAEQRAIAHILGTLDDKIELNRKMSETLEEMARALFKSWFVDFDPVRAKSEGRETGLPKAVADLFPDSFEDLALGEIPAGWTLDSLGSLADVQKGLSYKGAGLADEGGMPMINLGCFAGDGRFKGENVKRYTGEYRNRHTVRAGDLLVANTDMTQRRIILGSPIVVPVLPPEDTFLFTHHTFAVRFKEGSAKWLHFIYLTLLLPAFRAIAAGYASGTTVLALPQDALLKHPLALPTEPLRAAFEALVKPLLGAVDVKAQESKTLGVLRDTLLPKLVSGELRVKDAERFVQEAV